jgi:hypothetical protein
VSGVFCFNSLCLILQQSSKLKNLSFIVSLTFLLTVLWAGQVDYTNLTHQFKDKKEAQTKVQVASSHAVVPFADIKLVTPFLFISTSKSVSFFDAAPIRFVSNFFDRLLKILLVCLISPHAP